VRLANSSFYHTAGCVIHATDPGTTVSLEQCVLAQNQDGLTVCCADDGDVSLSRCIVTTRRESAFFNRSGVVRVEESTCEVREKSEATIHDIREEMAARKEGSAQATPWYDVAGQLMGAVAEGNRDEFGRNQAKQKFTVYRAQRGRVWTEPSQEGQWLPQTAQRFNERRAPCAWLSPCSSMLLLVAPPCIQRSAKLSCVYKGVFSSVTLASTLKCGFDS
jgi:hypothetical protein